MLRKLHRRVCGTVGHKLVPSLEPWALCRDPASLNLFCRYYFGRCTSKVSELLSLASDMLHFRNILDFGND